MEPTPVTDIVMAAHNAVRTIDASIQSVREQSDPAWRLWVIDDGSDDDTALHANRYSHDPRIQVISQPGAGAAAARNRGLDAIGPRSAFVAFLDSDDIWQPEFLATMRSALHSDPGAGLAWCEMECFEGVSGRYRGDRLPVVGEAEETLPLIFSQVPFLGSSVLCRGKFFHAGLRYPERYRTMEDVHVWSSIAAQSRVIHVHESLVEYRVSASSLSNGAGSMLRNYRDNVRSYRELYRTHQGQISRDLYRERMWRAHHFAGEDRMHGGHSGWLCFFKALVYRPRHAATWKNLAIGARARLRPESRERSRECESRPIHSGD